MAPPGEAVAVEPGYGRRMQRRTAPRPLIMQAAALARLDEMGGQRAMTTEPMPASRAAEDPYRELKAAARGMWALGDYHRFATELVWDLGPRLVAACGIGAGQRVLDVAAGTGNVALRAAEAGAHVVASDLTPENFDAGRREARARGLEIEWVQGDAERLPFADAAFDVVTSSLGAIFAPDHQAVADEMLRVCRPGGTIGMINFTPDGLGGEFFELFGRHAPPPPSGMLPPLLWGSEDHVRELFGDRMASLEMTRTAYTERMDGGARAYVDFFQATFGPVVALSAGLAEEPQRAAAFDREFLDFATRRNSGAPGGRGEWRYDVVLVVGRTSGS
jgi:ubiquinone/menaquinone biosynthesis C-methylase UbiE